MNFVIIELFIYMAVMFSGHGHPAKVPPTAGADTCVSECRYLREAVQTATVERLTSFR